MEELIEGEIVATVAEVTVSDLEVRVAELESRIETLMSAAAKEPVGRKTVSSFAASAASKKGVALVEGISAGALDTALASLSVEQRIAVKMEMLRSGLMQ